MISTALLNYILEFLLGDFRHNGTIPPTPWHQLIAYTDNEREMQDALVVIKASAFFRTKTYGTEAAEPQLPLREWAGIPLLYGEPRYEWINEGKTLLLHADIVASSYYLLSRYEEMIHRNKRDEFGRFCAIYALPYRAGFLHRPVVDEYGRAFWQLLVNKGLTNSLGLSTDEKPRGFRRINLSHSLHSPYLYRGWRALWYRLRKKADPYNTFDALYAYNQSLAERSPWQVNTLLFLKARSTHRLDKPQYKLRDRRLRHILQNAEHIGAKFGLLCSYAASKNPHLIPEEMKDLRAQLKGLYRQLYGWQERKTPKSHHQQQERRCLKDLELISSHHNYFALGEPEDTREMLAAGIRHDYTMTYADIPGFRLGTCRPVRFINPNTRSLTDLIMHPLCLSDTALKTCQIKHHQPEQLLHCTTALIDMVYLHRGELNILWHNETLSPTLSPQLSQLYQHILDYILSKQE